MTFVCLALPFACVSSTARSSWEYIPQEIRMIEADLVLAGEVVKSGKNLRLYGQEWKVRLIKPIRLLKGTPRENKPIRLVWPTAAALPAPQVGDRSIWILRADRKQPIYWATYPADRQPIEKLAEVQERLATIEKIKWSEPSDGLRLAVFVEQRALHDATIDTGEQKIDAVARLAIYPLLKNVGDEPIQINKFKEDTPFSILLHSPDGQFIDVPMYARAPLQSTAPARQDFIRVPVDRVRSLPHGFMLPIMTEEGVYTIRLRYKNFREVTPLQPEKVWMGATASPTIAVEVRNQQDGGS